MNYNSRLTDREIELVGMRMRQKIPPNAIASEIYVIFRGREGDPIKPQEVVDAYKSIRQSKSGCLNPFGLLKYISSAFSIDD